MAVPVAGCREPDRRVVYKEVVGRDSSVRLRQQIRGCTRLHGARLKISHCGLNAAVPGQGYGFAERQVLPTCFSDEPGAQRVGAEVILEAGQRRGV